MISENRLKATIDQVCKLFVILFFFLPRNFSSLFFVAGYLIFENDTNLLSKVDEEINNICQEVNNFLYIWETECM
jgi:hypothetical protein